MNEQQQRLPMGQCKRDGCDEPPSPPSLLCGEHYRERVSAAAARSRRRRRQTGAPSPVPHR